MIPSYKIGEIAGGTAPREIDRTWWTSTSSGTLCCQWCGKDLSSASSVTYLNGNQAVCDLCLRKTDGIRRRE